MNQKHLTEEQRKNIEHGLDEGLSFKAIAQLLGKDCTTVSREIRRHLTSVFSGAKGRAFNDCESRFTCLARGICRDCNKKDLCRHCGKCLENCAQYRKEICSHLIKSPYVCNGCRERSKCTLEKKLYLSNAAQSEYRNVLSDSRSGFNLDDAEIERLDKIISPLIKKGHSVLQARINRSSENEHKK